MLRRVGDQFEPAPPAFEQLMTPRQSGRRRTRMLAGLVGLLLAGLGFTLAFGFLRGPGHAPSGSPAAVGLGEPIKALWPEGTREELAAAQARIDAGHDRWRLEAFPTAQRFAERILGWSMADPEPCIISGSCAARPGEPTVFVYRSLPCPADGTPDCEVVIVDLRRLGEGGAWSVVRAWSTGFLLFEVEPGQSFQSGDSISLQSHLPEGTRVQVGWVYRTECGSVGNSGAATVTNRRITFVVATRGFTCEARRAGEAMPLLTPSLDRPVHGYVFLALVANPVGPTDVDLFDRSRFPGYLRDIQDLAAIPARFLPA